MQYIEIVLKVNLDIANINQNIVIEQNDEPMNMDIIAECMNIENDPNSAMRLLTKLNTK